MPRDADALPLPGIRSPLAAAGITHLLCVATCGVAAAAGVWPLSLGAWLCIEGASAAVIGRVIGLPWWWMPINLLFFPVMYVLLDVQIPPWVFLGVFCALLLVNGAVWFQRVPFFLSSERAAVLVRALLPPSGGFRLIDLGCGSGSFLSSLACQRPDGRYAGIELAPLPFLLSRWRASRQPAMNVRWGDFWRTDLADYDVVYAYLSPAPMSRLWEKACREMRPGSLLVSNGFSIAGAPPARVIPVGDAVRSTLYVWRM